jgi:phosphohistidine phosphatase
MDVILIRHAEAGSRDESQWPDDDLRPVSPEGRTRHTGIARAMKRLGIEFEFLVTSPLVRARQTADITAEVYGWKEPPQQSEALGHGCSVSAVVKLLGKFPPDSSVALVGHEPDLSGVAAALIGRSGDASIKLKKSGVIGISFDGAPEAGRGELMFLLKPGHLKKIK